MFVLGLPLSIVAGLDLCPVPAIRCRTMHHTLTIPTHGPGLYEFTAEAEAFVAEATAPGAGEGIPPARDGLLTLFCQHTSASLLIQENADPDVQRDLQTFFARLVPPADDPAMRWVVHTTEGPDDMPAHIRAALTQTSLSIPVMAGRMALGTWQGLYLFEHRTAPHRRRVVLRFGA